MLLAALLLGLGATNAQVTKYYKPGERKTTFAADDKVMFYNTALVLNNDRTGISQDRTGFLIGTTSFALDKQKPKDAPFFSEKVGVFTVETVEDQSTYYKVNVKGANGYVGIEGVVNNANASTLCFHKWTTVADNKKTGDDVASENATGEGFAKRTEIDDSHNLWIVANDDMSRLWNGNQASFTAWSTGHPYAIYSVVEATTAELETLLANAKTTAKNTLAELANMPLYTVGAAADEVDAVVMVDDDLETALNTIDAIVINVKKTIDGKNVTFQNHGSGERTGRFLGYDKGNSRAAAVVKYDNTGDEVIWTMKACDDGTFKLYNFANNLYLGAPGSAATHVEEASAPSFRFAASTNNTYPSTFVLVCSNGQWLHVENGNNYKLMSYQSTTDGASLWTISEVGTIQITRDNYNAKSTVLNDLMAYAKQLQDEVGLVTSDENVKVVVNHPNGGDSQPSSNLLDGNNSSFVHSAYEDDDPNVTNHYIEVELSKATRNIFCYFSKRNNNNRPAVIKVLAGNSAEDITTEVATLTMGESYDDNVQSYVSKGIDLGAEYKHLRFVVTKTNTGSKFFTLSEFYVLPIDEETQNISNLTSASITDADINTKVEDAQSYLKGFLFADVYDVLQANENNHAATPALGQYPTAAYEALEAAFNDDAATQQTLEEAVAAFEAAKNVPVYFITSKHDDYAAGSAIYYDGANWKWKTANIYDRQMWMTIPSYTNADVPVVNEYDANGTHYAICDYLTGSVMRGKNVQIVKINGWDGVYNLQYGTTTYDAVQHAQSNAWGSNIVGWNPATTTDNKASAWGVEFIGNSYDLAKLTDEYLAKGNELAAINVPNFGFKEDMNSYDPATKPALDAAVANRATVLSKFSTADEIAAAKNQLETAIAGVKLNMPENGKFYRVRCAGEGMKRIQSTINNDRLQMIGGDPGINANSIFCYIDGSLLSYTTGQYINAYNLDAVGTKSTVAFSEAYNGTLGEYNIKINNSRYIYGKKDEIDSGTGNPTDGGYNWWLEEVTTLPVAVSAAGYATLYAPVALKVPAEGVTAHTVTIDGEKAILSEALEVIPAETGVILVGTEGTYNFTVTTYETGTSALAGTFAKTYVTDDAYVLAKKNDVVGLYKATKNQQGNTAFLNNAFKAYLPAPVGSEAPMFSFGRGEGTTSIDQLINTDSELVIYDLAGRRVQKMEKGIYIVNGKKVIR